MVNPRIFEFFSGKKMKHPIVNIFAKKKPGSFVLKTIEVLYWNRILKIILLFKESENINLHRSSVISVLSKVDAFENRFGNPPK